MSYEDFKTPNTLEDQYNNRETTSDGQIEIVDIQSDSLKTEVPVVLGMGWGGEPKAYKQNILSLAETGRRTIAIDAVHGVDSDIENELSQDLPEIELRKVAAIMEALESKDIEKVDAVGYSEGGIYITLAAMLYPEKFRNLVLVNPGGMIGQDNEARLTAGFLKDLFVHLKQSIGDKQALQRFGAVYGGMVKSAGKDILKAVKEISAISDSQIQEYLKSLKEQGIGISIIHGVDDSAFPMDKMQKETKPEHVDGFYSVQGAHVDFVIQAEKYTHVVDQALDALERKRNK